MRVFGAVLLGVVAVALAAPHERHHERHHQSLQHAEARHVGSHANHEREREAVHGGHHRHAEAPPPATLKQGAHEQQHRVAEHGVAEHRHADHRHADHRHAEHRHAEHRHRGNRTFHGRQLHGLTKQQLDVVVDANTIGLYTIPQAKCEATYPNPNPLDTSGFCAADGKSCWPPMYMLGVQKAATTSIVDVLWQCGQIALGLTAEGEHEPRNPTCHAGKNIPCKETLHDPVDLGVQKGRDRFTHMYDPSRCDRIADCCVGENWHDHKVMVPACKARRFLEATPLHIGDSPPLNVLLGAIPPSLLPRSRFVLILREQSARILSWYSPEPHAVHRPQCVQCTDPGACSAQRTTTEVAALGGAAGTTTCAATTTSTATSSCATCRASTATSTACTRTALTTTRWAGHQSRALLAQIRARPVCSLHHAGAPPTPLHRARAAGKYTHWLGDFKSNPHLSRSQLLVLSFEHLVANPQEQMRLITLHYGLPVMKLDPNLNPNPNPEPEP